MSRSKAGLMEPDAEDEPMDTFAGEAWAAVLVVPAAMVAVASVLERDAPLPVRLLGGVVGLVTGGAALCGLALAGRAAEQRRDLSQH